MNTAMILSAGRGERLKPLTHYLHKSLCPVQGKPLIEHHVSKLAKAGISRIIINHAYLGDQLRNYLGSGEKWSVEILYSPEPPGGLETGGGIVNALPLLGDDPFLTVNGDIYTDYNFLHLSIPKNALAHLVLIQNPLHNLKGDFGLDETQYVMNENKEYTYIGIAAFHPQAFQDLTYGRYSLTNSLLRPLAAKRQLSGEVFQGLWIDIGSPERLGYANQLAMEQKTCA